MGTETISLVVSNIVEVSMDKLALWICVCASNVNSVHVDDWPAKWAIIARNVNSVHVDDWTVEWVTIASNVTVSIGKPDFATANSFKRSKWMSWRPVTLLGSPKPSSAVGDIMISVLVGVAHSVARKLWASVGVSCQRLAVYISVALRVPRACLSGGRRTDQSRDTLDADLCFCSGYQSTVVKSSLASQLS